MDPGDVLAPAGDRPTHAELEGRQHLGKRTAFAVEHDAGAYLHDAHAVASLPRRPRPPMPDRSVRGSRCPRGHPRRSARRHARRSSRSPSRSPAPAAARPRPARRFPARDGACPSRGCRGWPAWPRRSSAARCSRRPGARSRRDRRALGRGCRFAHRVPLLSPAAGRARGPSPRRRVPSAPPPRARPIRPVAPVIAIRMALSLRPLSRGQRGVAGRLCLSRCCERAARPCRSGYRPARSRPLARRARRRWRAPARPQRRPRRGPRRG